MEGALKRFGYVYLGLVLVYIVLPAGIVAFDSINSATSFPSPFEHATMRWYLALLNRPAFISAAALSAEIALLSATTATVIAFGAAYALARAPLRGKHAIATALMGPLFVPEIVMGLAILQVISMVHVPPSLFVLVLAHTVFVMPFIFRLVLAGFSQFDFNLEDAARSLGARPFRALWRVTLPLLRPSLIAGFTLAAIMSFVNLPISMFLTTPRTATLPVAMFAYMESRIDPMIAAMATLMVLLAAAASIFLGRGLRIQIIG